MFATRECIVTDADAGRGEPVRHLEALLLPMALGRAASVEGATYVGPDPGVVSMAKGGPVAPSDEITIVQTANGEIRYGPPDISWQAMCTGFATSDACKGCCNGYRMPA